MVSPGRASTSTPSRMKVTVLPEPFVALIGPPFRRFPCADAIAVPSATGDSAPPLEKPHVGQSKETRPSIAGPELLDNDRRRMDGACSERCRTRTFATREQ